MQAIQRWFAKPPARASRTTLASSIEARRDETRREVLGLAVRDTLRRHGIPAQWITAETHSALTASRARGVHLRLVLREWQPRFFAYTVALQKAIEARLLRIDPLSPSWFAGMSWKLGLADETACPGLPPASYWEALRERKDSKPAALARELLDDVQGAGQGRWRQKADFQATEPFQR